MKEQILALLQNIQDNAQQMANCDAVITMPAIIRDLEKIKSLLSTVER